jgi:hypothetical protein
VYKSEIEEGACAAPEKRGDGTLDVDRHVNSVLRARLEARLNAKPVKDALCGQQLTRFIVAGGALLRGEARDIDVWPAPSEMFPVEAAAFLAKIPEGKTSVKVPVEGGPPLQLCRQQTKDLGSLIKNFDFAHCQVGAMVVWGMGSYLVQEIQCTDEFKAAMLVQGTFYTAVYWPKNSLERVHKIALKLGLTENEARALTKQVVAKMQTLKHPFGDQPVPVVLGQAASPTAPGKFES